MATPQCVVMCNVQSSSPQIVTEKVPHSRSAQISTIDIYLAMYYVLSLFSIEATAQYIAVYFIYLHKDCVESLGSCLVVE